MPEYTEQAMLELYPNHEHESCKGCCHLEVIYSYHEHPTSHRLIERKEYGCDLSPWGYLPVGHPKSALGCPTSVPERYETDYIKGHPWGVSEVRYA